MPLKFEDPAGVGLVDTRLIKAGKPQSRPLFEHLSAIWRHVPQRGSSSDLTTRRREVAPAALGTFLGTLEEGPQTVEVVPSPHTGGTVLPFVVAAYFQRVGPRELLVQLGYRERDPDRILWELRNLLKKVPARGGDDAL